jgi:isobutyryl-CoA mutase large subunit
VIDPLGGSYFVEELTDKTEREAEDYFTKIDELGNGSILDGMLRGIEEGYFQGEIADAAYVYQNLLDKKRKIVVGVNMFERPEQADEIETLYISPETERLQVKDLQGRKADRDQGSADAALKELVRVASTDENMIPALIECSRAECTLGEMVNALKEPFGIYVEPPRF